MSGMRQMMSGVGYRMVSRVYCRETMSGVGYKFEQCDVRCIRSKKLVSGLRSIRKGVKSGILVSRVGYKKWCCECKIGVRSGMY